MENYNHNTKEILIPTDKKQYPQKTYNGHPVTDDMLKIMTDFDELFDSVFQEECNKVNPESQAEGF